MISTFESGDFDVEDRHSDGKEKIFEDYELKSLYAGDSYQMQGELTTSLGAIQQAISKHLTVMGMIQKKRKYHLYPL